MGIEHISAYLVPPGKGKDTIPNVGSTDLKLDGKLFSLLKSVYDKSKIECDLDISFNVHGTSAVNNPSRNLIVSFIQNPSLPLGRLIAERLRDKTDSRSKVGLLFLIYGKEGSEFRMVLSRFPTEIAILVEENSANLSVEFLDEVFVKNQYSYKAVVYQDASFTHGFFTGRAVERQNRDAAGTPSNYWISDFLDSGFLTTSAAGTKRLAVALREAAKKSNNLTVKQEIASFANLAKNHGGKTISPRSLAESIGLSQVTKAAIFKELGGNKVADEQFVLDSDTFAQQVPYRTVDLDSGVMLTAPTNTFDETIHREVLDQKSQTVRFSTQGKITNDKLTKSKL